MVLAFLVLTIRMSFYINVRLRTHILYNYKNCFFSVAPIYVYLYMCVCVLVREAGCESHHGTVSDDFLLIFKMIDHVYERII